MNGATLLQVSRIRKQFGKRWILRYASIELQAGECVLLCGDNGAGKTTLLRILAGLERPDEAQVSDPGATHSWRRARKILLGLSVYLHQTAYMFDGSVTDNLAHALPRPLRRREQSRRQLRLALDWADLNPIARSPARSLSGGERQRVALARAWLSQSRLLLLDEPTTNMDQPSRQRTLDLLQALKVEGHTLLLASHDPEHFLSLADRRLQLDEGRITPFSQDTQTAVTTESNHNVTPMRRNLSW